MERQPYLSYSWHQSHDQATVLLMIPHDVQEEDMLVTIEKNYLIAGVRGQLEIVKGRLYGNVDTKNSMWQIESRTSRSTRERTTSSSSTASTHSSYAFVSDAEISSSFAGSLESGPTSDAEDFSSPSPALSSPTSDQRGFNFQRRSRPQSSTAASRPESPGRALQSMASSFSSLESLQTVRAGRLLTIHLEKEQPIIWPSLIVGPVSLGSPVHNSIIFNASHELEHQYNMDPTSLVLVALEMFDVRKDKDEAFECFIRAWHLAHVPTATMKLTSHYLPLQTSFNLDKYQTKKQAPRGTTMYYLQCIGGPSGLAQLYLEAGMLHLDGAASNLMASGHSSLSSLRLPIQEPASFGGTEAWKRDRAAAIRYFDRARALQPDLDIPAIPPINETFTQADDKIEEFEMPSIDIDVPSSARRRRKKEETTAVDNRQKVADVDNTWYLYLPGLVGAGTALVLVGVIGALSFSTLSRRNQGS